MNGWTYADIWENVAAVVPEAPAVVDGRSRRNWAEFDARANGIARYLLDHGCVQADKVAFYMHNRNEYLELFFACSKVGLNHVNTNYRYADEELVYIWDNADTVAVVFEGTFTETIERVRGRVERVHTWLWLDDGTNACPDWAVPYETAATTATDGRTLAPWGRSGDDQFLLYTGGTTGMPKGVMWRQDDIIVATDASNKLSLPEVPDLDDNRVSAFVRSRASKPGPVSLPACPLMHGTGLYNSMNTLSLGGSIVCLPSIKFSVEEMLDVIEAERVKSTFIVGDAFAKPILAALDAEPDRWDISSLRVIISSGVMFSADSKAGLLRHSPRLIIVDTLGSSEAIGMASSTATSDADTTKTAAFKLSDKAAVITDDGRLVEAGSGEIGKLGLRGRNPVGYYKDPEKSAATFPVINDIRYSVPGDFATVEADGSITLLGRGSVCINSGGEKIFPEEVEETVKTFAGISDAIAVGIPDDRFGQAVTAVVAVDDPSTLDESAVIDHVKSHLASYKAPKRVFAVTTLDRAANGKIDYKRWTAFAEEQANA